jgi:hypothetical protein
MRTVPAVVSVVVIAALSGFAATEIYKWIDEQGNVHYGDSPPANIAPERVELEGGASAPADPGDELRRVLEQAEARAARRAAERSAASVLAEAERTARSAEDDRCVEARMRLAVLDTQRPVYRGEDGRFRVLWGQTHVLSQYETYAGEREYLDDAARASETARARADIAASCRRPDDAAEHEAARVKWLRSELCAAARFDLQNAERPGMRTPRSELQKKRERVSELCEE